MANPRASPAGLLVLRPRAFSRTRVQTSIPGSRTQNDEVPLDSHTKCSQDAAVFEHDVGASPSITGGFQPLATSMSALKGMLLNDSQMKILNKAINVPADVLVGRCASQSVRFPVQQILRTTLFVAYHVAPILAFIGILTQSDLASHIAASAELTATVCAMLFSADTAESAIPLPLPVEAIAVASSLLAAWMSLCAAAAGLAHLDPHHLNVMATMEQAFDLVISSSCLSESCEELMDLIAPGWQMMLQQIVAIRRPAGSTKISDERGEN
ncbi:hypothetical protein VOLCADRAFT_95764 [Volvox carteri f. nagariensis]|uniref:Uncharacterized protein n=1 Tax=Volvox carteri f. nagariensis TaxID=3068 RepID=D8U8B7_VOLCA|nr:uncharacterized protein VOLCADRAFT_95764 [Volvox carteri f. nagariensis]EFJ44063.1 hypothetical protein VOLCADRAFT_95764 [Volvox carteri f. nagariensis]|eukprot:XP_002954864.1 hypothetical protein VOLCADRAFT_95764 [Volvox carteri f. nagariensis]